MNYKQDLIQEIKNRGHNEILSKMIYSFIMREITKFSRDILERTKEHKNIADIIIEEIERREK